MVEECILNDPLVMGHLKILMFGNKRNWFGVRQYLSMYLSMYFQHQCIFPKKRCLFFHRGPQGAGYEGMKQSCVMTSEYYSM